MVIRGMMTAVETVETMASFSFFFLFFLHVMILESHFYSPFWLELCFAGSMWLCPVHLPFDTSVNEHNFELGLRSSCVYAGCLCPGLLVPFEPVRTPFPWRSNKRKAVAQPPRPRLGLWRCWGCQWGLPFLTVARSNRVGRYLNCHSRNRARRLGNRMSHTRPGERCPNSPMT